MAIVTGLESAAAAMDIPDVSAELYREGMTTGCHRQPAGSPQDDAFLLPAYWLPRISPLR
jgi:hypothetical protein